MASQSETVILYSRWAIRMLYALSLLFFMMAVAAALFVALMMAGAIDLGSSVTGSLKIGYMLFYVICIAGGLRGIRHLDHRAQVFPNLCEDRARRRAAVRVETARPDVDPAAGAEFRVG